MFEALDTEVDKQLEDSLFSMHDDPILDVAGLKKLRERKLPGADDARTGGVNGLIKTHLIKATETQTKLIECLAGALGEL